MAFIEIPGPDESGRYLKMRYDAMAKEGKIPANIVRIQGHNDQVLKSSMMMYRDTMFGDSPLSRAQREMLATVVSTANNCHY